MKLSVLLRFDWASFWPALRIFTDSGTHPDPQTKNCFLAVQEGLVEKIDDVDWDEQINDRLIDTFLNKTHEVLTEAILPHAEIAIDSWVRRCISGAPLTPDIRPLLHFCGGAWLLFDKLVGESHNRELWHGMTPICGPAIYRDALLDGRYFYDHYRVSPDTEHLHLNMVDFEPLSSPTFKLSAIELISYWQRLIAPASTVEVEERHYAHGKADPTKGAISLVTI